MLTPFQKQRLVEIKWKLVGILGKCLVDFIFKTSIIEIKGQKSVDTLIKSKKIILAIWHSRILLFSYLFKNSKAAILVSSSDDGEIIARILQAQGQETIRGSTSRGGLRALASLIKQLRNSGQPACIIPDGPTGPRFQVQPGVIMLSKKTRYPIVPATYSAKKMIVFSSWDRFILPYPFTRCRMIWGNPVCVPADADQKMQNHCRKTLEDELNRITREADHYFGHRID